ncbi:MAG: Na/Pi cotransporter family protein [Nitrospinota bacterium]|nr:Na/Pi cotransporter family protein [Nitrospinota bacterium]
MDYKLITTMIFQAAGGLGLFLLGMRYMSDGVQSVAGGRLRKLIGSVTNNRLSGLAVGILFTCLVQSSSITTVMTVGLVNSGVMTLFQSLGIIMGANIGTTITGWILVLKIGKYGLPMLGFASFFYLFSKNEKFRFIGMIIMGIGMIFFGLELMKDGFKPMRSLPEFVAWFSLFEADSYFGVLKLAFIGCILTFIVQSSSATLAITMSLASTGVIHFESAAALVLGENIGTTITAFLASLGATTNAKRAAYAHIIFNVIGVLWITAVFRIYIDIIKGFLGTDPNTMLMVDNHETFPFIIAGIAIVHTGFNVTNTALFIPFVAYFEKLLLWLAPDKEVAGKVYTTHLDPMIIDTPLIAIDNAHIEIVKMGRIATRMMTNLKDAIGGETLNEKSATKVFHKEEILDGLQNEVSVFLTELLSSGLPHEITIEARQQLRIADEYESISDYIEKILKLHLRLRDNNMKLPAEELQAISSLHDDTLAYMELITNAYAQKQKQVISRAHTLSEAINHKVRKTRTHHIERLSHQKIEPLITMAYTDMINDYRRVKDHTLNIAEALAGEK